MRKNIYIPDEMNMRLAQLFTKSPDLERKFNPSKIIQEGIEKFINENSNNSNNKESPVTIFDMFKFKDNKLDTLIKNRVEFIKNKDLSQYEILIKYITFDAYRRVTQTYKILNKEENFNNELAEIDKEEELDNKQIRIKNIIDPSVNISPKVNCYIEITNKQVQEFLDSIIKDSPDFVEHLRYIIGEEIVKKYNANLNYPMEMSIPTNENPKLFEQCTIKSSVKVKELSDHDKKRLMEADNSITEKTEIKNAVYCSVCKNNLIELKNLCSPCNEISYQ